MKTKPLNLEVEESEFDSKMEQYYQQIPSTDDKEVPALILNASYAIPEFTDLLYKTIEERKPNDKFRHAMDYLIYSLIKLKEGLN